jgi:hypothetical protein
MKVFEVLKQTEENFKNQGICDYKSDARFLMEFFLNCSPAQLVLNMQNEIDHKKFLKLANKRLKGIPVQYITGSAEFMSLEFKVNKNVRTKTTQKRILLIAAVIAILVAILSFVSVAFEWDIYDVMKEKFGSVFNIPVGVEQVENGVTFVNNGNYQQYKSLEELTEKEELNILLFLYYFQVNLC